MSTVTNVLNAERIKLVSTRSPWWCTVIIILAGLGLAALVAAMVPTYQSHGFSNVSLTPGTAVMGVSGLGMYVLMIMAALSVTNEYRFGLVRVTFQATPNRALVLAAKAVLLAVFGAILTFVVGIAAFFIAKSIAGAQVTASLDLSQGSTWRVLYGVPLYAVLCVILAVGLGALLRQSVVTVGLLVLWPSVVEGILGAFGDFGRSVRPFLPFANANRFLGAADGTGTIMETGVHWHWGPWGGIIYFGVFVAIVFAAAVIVQQRRDA